MFRAGLLRDCTMRQNLVGWKKAEEPHEKDVPNRIPSEVRKMKLLFRQRAFSWFDSYDIYDENENTVYVVKGQLSWGTA